MKTNPANAQNADASISPKCDCAECFEVHLLRADQYDMFKSVLNRGRHPAFLGRKTFQHHQRNGGALIYTLNDAPIGVSLINAHHGILIALNVIPQHRGHGMGAAIMRFLIPNFARVIENKVPWFENLGYKSVGEPKKGQRWNTHLMVRVVLFDLAGKMKRLKP